ncbi:nuclear cap-binding protein subunit 3-like [Paramacrobiotus metropolitanus]|uniref:nuclear cap-binding protein subunit 3-like n=1 Tax=Paramacrobiotus metropolitanus TaxID=2943436 RepID=UPI0024460F3B|nr:nuclear cap-binding protein subunit 3-like [Paramacrobiotus metropolitanus]
MSSQDPLIVTRTDSIPRNNDDDFMRLSVSEEEAAEFGLEMPSQVVVPTRITAPVSIVKRAAPKPRPLPPTPLQSQIVNADGRNVVMSGDVEMEDASAEGKLIVETPPCKPATLIEASKLPALYGSLAMDLETCSVMIPKYRLDTLHVRGVDEMSTQDVLNYFASYKPERVEWVNDTSCNVAFPDEISAASALKDLSQPLRLSKKPLTESDTGTFCDAQTGEEVLLSDVVSFPIPVPQGTWRVVKNLPAHAKQLILRFARTIDKKPPNAQKYSQYYAKYGNANGKSAQPTTSYSHRSVFGDSGRRISTSSSEDHEPFGLCNPYSREEANVEVLEVDQRPSESRGYHRFLGGASERREGYFPYRRARSDLQVEQEPKIFRENSEQGGFDLRSLLQVRSSPVLQMNDLRNRLSNPNRIGSNDLRNRLNRRRGN